MWGRTNRPRVSAERECTFLIHRHVGRYPLIEGGAEAGPSREVACLACGEPLPARERNLILEYFLLRKRAVAKCGKRA
jgi:hypothetical protein